MEPKFNYDKVCYVLKDIACKSPLIGGSELEAALDAAEKSLLFSKSNEFLDQFQNSPDAVQTQVDMYAALADRFCKDLSSSLEKSDPALIEEAVNRFRGIYFALATMDIASIDGTTPLMVDYAMERLKSEGVDLRDCAVFDSKVKEYFSDFCDILKISEKLREEMGLAHVVLLHYEVLSQIKFF